MSRHVTSKWAKTKALLKSESIRPYIPETARMNRASLRSMLARYGMVYIKPNVGTFGGGVMRVEKLDSRGSGAYRYQLGVTPRTFATFDAMYRSLAGRVKRKPYLIQKGIRLLKYNGRRFDLRVMVQHNLSHEWETTGLIGRVAAPNKVVTNYHNGGTLTSIDKLMAAYLPRAQKPAYACKLSKLGVTVARRMQRHFPGIREIGLDLGIDRKLHPWILEVNTKPDPYIFRHLKDKRIALKVFRYARAYGRIKARRTEPHAGSQAQRFGRSIKAPLRGGKLLRRSGR